MQVNVTFRHMEATEALRQHAQEKVLHLNKYLRGALDSHIVLSVEKHMHKADIHIPFQGLVIRGEEASLDMYNSIDRAVDKIERQVKRYRNRLSDHHPREGALKKLRLQVIAHAEEQEVGHQLPNIVESTEINAHPMMVDEAVMQMDLANDDVLVFLNAKTDHINVLYRKKNHKYGLIETLNHG